MEREVIAPKVIFIRGWTRPPRKSLWLTGQAQSFRPPSLLPFAFGPKSAACVRMIPQVARPSLEQRGQVRYGPGLGDACNQQVQSRYDDMTTFRLPVGTARTGLPAVGGLLYVVLE